MDFNEQLIKKYILVSTCIIRVYRIYLISLIPFIVQRFEKLMQFTDAVNQFLEFFLKASVMAFCMFFFKVVIYNPKLILFLDHHLHH